MPKDTFFKIDQTKQNRVLKAAKTVFSKHHYSNVTVDRIVDQAKIAKGSFYQYFDNKEDLFTYIFFRLGIDKKDYLLRVIDESEMLDFAELLMVLDEKGQEYENQTKERRVIRQKLFECPQNVMREIVTKLLPDTYDVFDHAIKKYQKMGIIKEGVSTKQAGYIIASCFYNQALFPVEENHRAELKETIQQAIKYLLV